MWGWSGRKREAAPASPAQEDEVVLIPEAENTVRVFPFPVFETEVQRLNVEHTIAAEPIDSHSFVTSALSGRLSLLFLPHRRNPSPGVVTAATNRKDRLVHDP